MFSIQNTLYSLNNRCSIVSRRTRTGQWEATYKGIPAVLTGAHSASLLIASSQTTAYIYHPATGHLFQMQADSDIEYLVTGPVAETGVMAFYRSQLYLFLLGSDGRKSVVPECKAYSYNVSRNAIVSYGVSLSVYPLFACSVGNSMLLFGLRSDHRGSYIMIKKLIPDNKSFSLRTIKLNQPRCDEFYLGFVYRKRYVILLYHTNLKNLLFSYDSQTLDTKVFPSPFNEVPKAHACSIIWNECMLVTNSATIPLPANLQELLEQSTSLTQNTLTLQDVRTTSDGESNTDYHRDPATTPAPDVIAHPLSTSLSASGRKIYRHTSGILDVVHTSGYKVIESDFNVYPAPGVCAAHSTASQPVEMDTLSEISVQMPMQQNEFSSPTQTDLSVRKHPQMRSARILHGAPRPVPVSDHSDSSALRAIELALAEVRGEIQVLRGGITAADGREAQLKGTTVALREDIDRLLTRCMAIEEHLDQYSKATDATLANLQQRVVSLEGQIIKSGQQVIQS